MCILGSSGFANRGVVSDLFEKSVREEVEQREGEMDVDVVE
jgi:hypothetical protein